MTILLLKSGDTTVVAQAWSAGSNGGGHVFVTAHGGTTGLTIDMQEFIRLLAKHTESLDLRDLCEDPKVTMARLAKGGG